MEQQRQMYGGIMAAIHNAWLRGKSDRAFRPADFIGGSEGEEPLNTAEDQMTKMRMVFLAASAGLPAVDRPPSVEE